MNYNQDVISLSTEFVSLSFGDYSVTFVTYFVTRYCADLTN